MESVANFLADVGTCRNLHTIVAEEFSAVLS